MTPPTTRGTAAVTPRRFVAVWGVGTLCLGLATFWGVRILVTGTALGPGHDLLPPVKLNAAAQSFVDSLPVLGKGGAKSPGGETPHIQIPKLGVDSAIVELAQTDKSWFIDGLEKHIGHLQGTDAPGGTGNAVFAGHVALADNSPGPLAEVERLVPGDQIIVIAGRSRSLYEVTGQQQVGEDRLEVAYPTSTPQLTLITCARWSWLDGRYTGRVVVTARLVSAAPGP
jgi:LPXTG-site transpeptidase (sortase) family protein